MVEIRPFCGVRYDQNKVEIDDAVTQPYDNITPEMQKGYYKRSPFNYVRLNLNMDKDRYSSSAEIWSRWVREGILIKDDSPAIYPYTQTFKIKVKEEEDDESSIERCGVICAVKLEEFEKKIILPHERTLSRPKADRFELMNALKKNLEQIFLLYMDPEQKIHKILYPRDGAEIEVRDEYGVLHKVWREDDEEKIEKIRELLADRSLVIADGHHRYETSLNYRNLRRRSGDIGNEGYYYRMATLVNLFDPALIILPTHRMIFNISKNLNDILKESEEYFDIKKDACMEDLKGRSGAFILYAGKKMYLLELKDYGVMDVAGHSDVYKRLDVSILHSIFIEKILGISQRSIEDHLHYAREHELAMDGVDKGRYQLACLMNSTKKEEVCKIAENLEHMPQKSTDFYPKLISGLVAFDLDDKL